jgi:hypothetical protein
MSNIYLLTLPASVTQKGDGVDSVVCIAANTTAAKVLASAATAGDVVGIWENATIDLLGTAGSWVDGAVLAGSKVAYTAPVAS